MADKKNGSNGSTGAAKAEAPQSGPAQIQARIVNQYVKDLSFENPNIRKLIANSGEQPKLQVEVNVNAEKLDSTLYESAIELRATASNNIGTIYVLETVYAGLFKIDSIPEQALEPFLLITGPSMIFPFLRRLVADVTREGGYPPLMLDPIDFAGLYFRRKQEESGAEGTATA